MNIHPKPPQRVSRAILPLAALSLAFIIPQVEAGKVVIGAVDNTAGGPRSVVAGGKNNETSAGFAFIGAGRGNKVEASDASVLGGNQNTAAGAKSSVLTGYLNNSAGLESAIVSGIRNITSAGSIRSAVLSGTDNVIEETAWSSYIGGGYRNSNAGDRSAVLMGTDNIIGANALNTVVAGIKASSNHKNSFVFNSSLANPLATTKNGQFLVNATGGIVLNGGTTIQGPLSVSGGLSYEGAEGGIIELAGPQGEAGRDGVDGEKGPVGPRGPAGQDADGEGGKGVASAEINLRGDLILTLTDGTVIEVGSVSDPTWQQLGADIEGFSASISAGGNTLVVTSEPYYGDRPSSNYLRVYRYSGSSWQQLGADIEGFFKSISADGNTVAVGGEADDEATLLYSEYVRVYRYNGSSWQQLGPDVIDLNDGILPAFISADGNTVAVGVASYDEATSSYSVYVSVYRYNGSSWQQLGADIEGFSTSISADGNTVAVGGESYDEATLSFPSYLRVYRYNGSSWQQLGADVIDVNVDIGGAFMSADGNTVAVGVNSYDEATSSSSNYLRVCRYNGSSWQQLGADVIDVRNDYIYSASLSADGNTVAVGSESLNGAYVNVYGYNGSSWQQLSGFVEGIDPSVSADGNTVAVGGGGDSNYVRAYKLQP